MRMLPLEMQPREYDLGPLERIPPGEGRTFVVGGHVVAVFRTRSGAVHATQGRCPHRGGPLADGTVGGRVLVCPLHGRKFDLVSGVPLGHACGVLRTFPVRLGPRGEVWLTVEPASWD